MPIGAFDILLLVLILVMGFRGAVRGFLTELTTLGSLVLGLILAFLFYPSFSRTLDLLFSENLLNGPLAFVLIFAFVAILLGILKSFLKELLESLSLQHMDRSLGLVIGVLEGILLTYLIIVFFLSVPFWDFTHEIKRGFLTGPLLELLPLSLLSGTL